MVDHSFEWQQFVHSVKFSLYVCVHVHMYSQIPILRPPLGMWSLIRCTLGVENEEKNSLNFANNIFNR